MQKIPCRNCGMEVYEDAWSGHVCPVKGKEMSALDVQVDGTHYKDVSIQPIEYIHANGLNFSEGSIVKYITRWRKKGGVKDLEKIKHYVDLLIEMEKKYGSLRETRT